MKCHLKLNFSNYAYITELVFPLLWTTPLQLLHSTVGRKGGRMIAQTFCSFNMQTRTFFENINITAHKHFVSDVPPWFVNKPIVNYDFLLHCRKNDNPSIINAPFLEIINTNYYNFTLLYTDGSKGQLGTSSALFVPTSYTKKFIAINGSSSIFTAELYGILTALQWIAINRQQKSLIITDSCSVL